MSIHASPFQEGLYKIWVYFRVMGVGSLTNTLTIGNYYLSLGPETCASERLQFLRSFSKPLARKYEDVTQITYSGSY